jgi:hypothetical protein
VQLLRGPTDEQGQRRPTAHTALQQQPYIIKSTMIYIASVAAVDGVGVPPRLRPYLADHEQHHGDHHRQQEALGVQQPGVAASAVVAAAVATHAAARSRPHHGFN